MTARRVAVGLLLLVCAGCASVNLQTYVGQGLEEFAQQFLDTAMLYDTAYREGAITAKQYQAWADAVPTIQATYDRLYQLWASGSDPVSVRTELRTLRTTVAVYLLKLQVPVR